jgi:peptidoglycan/xylan/chitin deacetylase (PgdA/CDA1 family)
MLGAILAGCSAGVAAWGIYHPSSQLFGPIIRRTPAAGTIALTFDDGPSATTTPRLLDLLDRHGARATFFVLGWRVRARPELLREIARRGHAIGNHTDTHPRLVWHTGTTVDDEIRRCQRAVEDAAGISPRLFRPPFGYRHPRLATLAARAGIGHVVTWSVITRDWTGRSEVIARRCARVRDRDVIVLHDGEYRGRPADREPMLRAVAEWLPRWRDAGYQPIALDDESLRRAASATHSRSSTEASARVDRT